MQRCCAVNPHGFIFKTRLLSTRASQQKAANHSRGGARHILALTGRGHAAAEFERLKGTESLIIYKPQWMLSDFAFWLDCWLNRFHL